jgi:hypothetical protein
MRHPQDLVSYPPRDASRPFAIGSRPCQEKNHLEVREQQQVSETNSNLQKQTERIRSLNFRPATSRERSTPYTAQAMLADFERGEDIPKRRFKGFVDPRVDLEILVSEVHILGLSILL